MNIAIVNDQRADLLAAKTFLTYYLEKNFAETAPSVQLQIFANSEDFLSNFKPEAFDLIILDIFMKPLNGIQVAQIVRDQNRDDFIPEGYEVFAVGYFLKPLSENLKQSPKLSVASTLKNAIDCKFIFRTNS